MSSHTTDLSVYAKSSSSSTSLVVSYQRSMYCRLGALSISEVISSRALDFRAWEMTDRYIIECTVFPEALQFPVDELLHLCRRLPVLQMQVFAESREWLQHHSDRQLLKGNRRRTAENKSLVITRNPLFVIFLPSYSHTHVTFLWGQERPRHPRNSTAHTRLPPPAKCRRKSDII